VRFVYSDLANPVRFIYPDVPNPSCNQLHDRVQFVLLHLGARASDLVVNPKVCYAIGSGIVDATFSVLTPTAAGRNSVAGEVVEARWQTIELKWADEDSALGLDECIFLMGIRVQILPLFSARDATRITKADCRKTGVGVRAQVLKPLM
jgi:hypothetical protein